MHTDWTCLPEVDDLKWRQALTHTKTYILGHTINNHNNNKTGNNCYYNKFMVGRSKNILHCHLLAVQVNKLQITDEAVVIVYQTGIQWKRNWVSLCIASSAHLTYLFLYSEWQSYLSQPGSSRLESTKPAQILSHPLTDWYCQKINRSGREDFCTNKGLAGTFLSVPWKGIFLLVDLFTTNRKIRKFQCPQNYIHSDISHRVHS